MSSVQGNLPRVTVGEAVAVIHTPRAAAQHKTGEREKEKGAPWVPNTEGAGAIRVLRRPALTQRFSQNRDSAASPTGRTVHLGAVNLFDAVMGDEGMQPLVSSG